MKKQSATIHLFALCMKITVVNKFSFENITRYAKKVNKKVVAYQAIVGYIYQLQKMQSQVSIKKKELFRHGCIE